MINLIDSYVDLYKYQLRARRAQLRSALDWASEELKVSVSIPGLGKTFQRILLRVNS